MKDTRKEYFGEVRWCEEDLVTALEERGYPVTENNIAKLYAACSRHGFVDYMIESGWEYMYSAIGMDGGWDTYDKPNLTLKHIYKEQLEYVKAIVEDIYKHKCSEEVIEHAAKYAQVENCFEMFWRVNFGEIYGYVEVDENPRIPSVYYNADEIGCYDTTYDAIAKALDAKTEEELADTDFGWCYDDALSKGEYHLEYKTFKN